jgi:anti-sigma B factor antagonist
MTLDDGSPPEGVPRASALTPEVGSVHVLIDPDRVHIVLTGEIDASTAPDLSTAAMEALSTGRPIEVDCRYVTFMDSTGVGFLARLAARSATRVRLLHPTAMVRFLLDTVMISDLVTFVEDEPATTPEPPPAS